MGARPHAPKVRRGRREIAGEFPRFAEGEGIQEAVAAEIAREAHDAIGRSGYAVGAHLLERAASLTGDETAREQLFLSAADAFVRAGRPVEAAHLLDTPPLVNTDRAECVRVRARLARLRGRVDEAIDTLIAEGQRLAGTNPRMAARLLVDAAIAGQPVGDRRALAAAQRAVELSNGDLLSRLVLDATLLLFGDSTEPTHARTLEHQALQLVETMGTEVTDEIVYGPVVVLLTAGEHHRALRVVEALASSIRRSGAVALLPDVLNVRGIVSVRLGEWDAALADFTESVRLADELGQRFDAAASLAWLARLLAVRGDEEACRSAVARARPAFVELGAVGERWLAMCDKTMRLLHLTLGRPEDVLAETIGAADLPLAEDWIEAAIRVGRTEDAEAMLSAYEAEISQPAESMRAARCRGLLAADDDFERFFDLARETVPPPDLFEQARIELCLGERRRRAGRRVESRAPLESAADAFTHLGARPWAERACRELRATGARTHGSGTAADLTAQEFAVARAVAGGATNKEAAAQLFLSVRTIEFHLRNAYAKLGIRSRSALARRLTDS